MNQFRLKNRWEYENGFYLTSDASRIGKTLSQFEIFKEILNVKGDIFEFGVFKGASLMRLASFRKLLKLEKKEFMVLIVLVNFLNKIILMIIILYKNLKKLVDLEYQNLI